MQDSYILKSITNEDGSPKRNPIAQPYLGRACVIECLNVGLRATLKFSDRVAAGLKPFLVTSTVREIDKLGNLIKFKTSNSIYNLEWKEASI